MAMIEINKNPSRRDLRWFGALIMLFFGLLGMLAHWRYHAPDSARLLWMIGFGLGALYYAVPPLRRWLFVGWMYAAFPLGWTISHIVLIITFYLIFTPIGLLMRLLGRDALGRRFESDQPTYWVECSSSKESGRYFKQF